MVGTYYIVESVDWLYRVNSVTVCKYNDYSKSFGKPCANSATSSNKLFVCIQTTSYCTSKLYEAFTLATCMSSFVVLKHMTRA